MDTNTSNTINTGKMLEDYMTANTISLTALAKKLNRMTNSVVRYRENTSIGTNMLETMCHQLKHNFFADIAAQLPADYSTSVKPDTTKDDRIAQLEHENALLKAEKAVLLEALKG